MLSIYVLRIEVIKRCVKICFTFVILVILMNKYHF
jgi:hypothetical protein